MLTTRQAELAGLLEDLDRLRERDPEADELLVELGTVCETLKAQAREVS